MHPGLIAGGRLAFIMEEQGIGPRDLIKQIGNIPKEQQKSLATGISSSRSAKTRKPVSEERQALYEKGLRVPPGTLDGSSDVQALRNLMARLKFGINAEKLATAIKEKDDDLDDLAGEIGEYLGADGALPDEFHAKLERNLNVYQFTLLPKSKKSDSDAKVAEEVREAMGAAKPVKIDETGGIHRSSQETKDKETNQVETTTRPVKLVLVGNKIHLDSKDGPEIDDRLAVAIMWPKGSDTYQGEVTIQRNGKEHLLASDQSVLQNDILVAMLWGTRNTK